MIVGLIFKFYDCMFIYMVKCKPKPMTQEFTYFFLIETRFWQYEMSLLLNTLKNKLILQEK